MAIAFGSNGSAANGTATAAVPYPAVVAAGDLLILCIVNKYPTNGPATPAGWVAPTRNQASGGSGTSGVDKGSVYATVFLKIADGTETGNVNLSAPSGNVIRAVIDRYTKSADGTWDIACAVGSDNAGGTSWSAAGDVDPGLEPGDLVFCLSAVNTDAATFTAEAVAAAGVTFGAAVERHDGGTANGDDISLVVSEHPVTAGTSSGVPTYTMTGSTSPSGDAPAGATVFVRLRELLVTGSASGSASATGAGSATATAAGAAAGAAAAAGSGDSTASATGSAAGSATVAGEATSSATSSGAAAGASSAAGAGSATASDVVGTASGAATADAAGAGAATATGAAAGAASAEADASSTATGEGLATGSASASAEGSAVVAEATGFAAGTSTAWAFGPIRGIDHDDPVVAGRLAADAASVSGRLAADAVEVN